jgi:hypothetical protein
MNELVCPKCSRKEAAKLAWQKRKLKTQRR